jgi:hypothetical protein
MRNAIEEVLKLNQKSIAGMSCVRGSNTFRDNRLALVIYCYVIASLVIADHDSFDFDICAVELEESPAGRRFELIISNRLAIISLIFGHGSSNQYIYCIFLAKKNAVLVVKFNMGHERLIPRFWMD